MKDPRIAVVHEWFVDYSGSEKVVEQMLNCFPESELFSLIEFLPEKLRFFIKNKKVTTSFIQRLPFAKTNYRNYLPLMPFAVEQLNVSKADIIITSNHAVSKGVISNSNQLTICYCHSPIRYAWDLYFDYLEQSNLNRGITGLFAKFVLHKIRQWDLSTVNRVDYFIANSNYIARRIKKIYNREATVIHPPVDIEEFSLKHEKENFYMTSSRLVQYKKIDLIVRAFNEMPEKRLVVIGDGAEMKKIKSIAGKNIELMGFLEKKKLVDYMQRAKAFVFAAEEDFGITPVEAQACGTPVIAFRKGGCMETIIEHKTGLFFNDQHKDSIIDAVKKFENIAHIFDPSEIRKNAERFSNERFRHSFSLFVEEKYAEFRSNLSH